MNHLRKVLNFLRDFFDGLAWFGMLFWGGAVIWFMVSTDTHRWLFWAIAVAFIAKPVWDTVDDIRYWLFVRKIKSGKVK